MSKSERKLPDAELELLAALCRLEEATARDVREAIERYRPMAHGSVLTLLGRLEEKALVTKRKGDAGKAFIYHPTAAGRAIFRPVVRNLLQRVFGGDSVSFVASLFESTSLKDGEIEELQNLLDELRKRRERK